MAKENKTYYQKLQSPLWQKKRNGILERDSYTCQQCKSTDKTLHVHHWTYAYGREPWEYPDKNLITLCADCHMSVEEDKISMNDIIHDMLIEGMGYKFISEVLRGKFVDFLNNQP